MKESTRETVLIALEKVLRPLANMLIKVGIGHREFTEISKRAFVGVATDNYGRGGRPTNTSRVSRMTGISRREVARVKEMLATRNNTRLAPAVPVAEILNQWFIDPEYSDAKGQPLPLPFDGEGPSFRKLVNTYSTGIAPELLLIVLQQGNFVSEIANNRLQIHRRDFHSSGLEERLERALAHPIQGLLTNIDNNLQLAIDECWVERMAFSRNVSDADLGRLEHLCKQRSKEFIDNVNDIFSLYESRRDASADATPSKTVGLGLYFFELADN